MTTTDTLRKSTLGLCGCWGRDHRHATIDTYLVLSSLIYLPLCHSLHLSTTTAGEPLQYTITAGVAYKSSEYQVRADPGSEGKQREWNDDV